MSLKDARIANLGLGDVSSGTVADLVDVYIKKEAVKLKRPELFTGYMDRAVLPAMGRRKVRDIVRADCVDLIESYSSRGARTADVLRNNLSNLFGYAVERGMCETNPVLGITRRISGYKPVARERVLTDDEIREVWACDSPNAGVLRFLLLTGLRISESRNGHREGDRWIVPAEFSKGGEEHWVHLTPEAIKQLPMTTCTGTNIRRWLRARAGYTPHDCRRSFVTRLNDGGVMPHIVEKSVGHKLAGMMAVYNRAEYVDERIAAVSVMESIILKLIAPVQKTDSFSQP